jgi:4-hydroxy-tetrahydrodipicolinate synthase
MTFPDAKILEVNLSDGKVDSTKLLPALNMLETFGKPVQALKYATSLKGLTGGYVKRPRLELTEEEKTYVKNAMNIDNIS